MRKKWTVNTDISDSLIILRGKKKWQIALRRFVLEKNKSSFYAIYFGLDISSLRAWVELQFDSDMKWDNFSSAWQFDHIIPPVYFDFNTESDLKLCWNFTNIRVQKKESFAKNNQITDILTAKAYFESLYKRTNYFICGLMVEKIIRIEETRISESKKLTDFIVNKKQQLDILSTLSPYEFAKLNSTVPLSEIIAERSFLKKFDLPK